MEIDRKLRAIQNLKDMLDKSETATIKMVKILDEFDDRLKKLETSVTPIYKESGNLQTRLKNAEGLLHNLEHVMEYYTTVKETQPLIDQNDNIDNYLFAMDKIVSAKEFFSENNIASSELHQIKQLYSRGIDSLDREYSHMLLQQSRPIPPHIILDLMNNDQDSIFLSEITSEAAVTMSTIPDNIVEDLHKLSLWLSVNSESPDFMNIYSSIRGDTLMASLKGFRDHIKSQSGSGSSLSTPSSMLSAYKSFPSETSYNAVRNLKRRFFGKTSAQSGTGPGSSLIAKYASFQITDPGDYSRGQTVGNNADVEVEIYLTSLHALLKLMQVEEKVMNLIIPESLFWQVYGELIQPTLDTVLTEGEAIVSAVKSAVRAQDFSPALSVFPIYKFMQSLRPAYDSILLYCKPVSKQKFDSLMDHMSEASYTLLEDYLEMVRNDPDKLPNLPKDGIVHEITSNACLYLEGISEFIDIIGDILTKRDFSSKTPPLAADYRKAFSVYASRVLSTLGLNLRLKYEAYADEALGSIFLINNFSYILKFMQKTSLLATVCIATPKVEEYYNQQIQEFKRIYSQSWSKVVYYMSDKSGPNLHLSRSQMHSSTMTDSFRDSFKLKDKDKQAVKEKFSGFNKEFEEICANQKRFSVPDAKIRETILLETKAFIIPLYRDFRKKYVNVSFSKNPEKYIKYQPEEVADQIDQFFAGID